MPNLYNAYVQVHVRKVIAHRELDVQGAIDFLKDNPKHGVITDTSNNEISLEELKNAKNFGSSDRTGPDNPDVSVAEVSEDSYRELFELAGDNSE